MHAKSIGLKIIGLGGKWRFIIFGVLAKIMRINLDIKYDHRWKSFDLETPERSIDVLILSRDKRMWVGAYCDDDDCNELHYQTTSFDPNYIVDPLCWIELPSMPIKYRR